MRRERWIRDVAEAVLPAMEEIVLACDESGHIRYTNRAACHSHGLNRPDDFELQMREACEDGRVRRLDGTALALEDLPLHRAFNAGEVVRDQFIVEVHRGKPAYRAAATAIPLRGDGGVVGAVVVGHDVSDEEQLERLKGQFVATAAHELKTPLAIIKGDVQCLRQAGRTDESLQHKLDRISRGVARIDHVVTELLDLSLVRLGRLVMHREPVDLRELVERAVARAPALAPGQRIVLRGDPVVPAFADRLRISQVVANLVSNAIRHSPDGGDVEIDVSRDAIGAIVSVRDHGIGIARRAQARMFEPFHRPHADTPNDRGGLGLGLYLSGEFVAAHGGRMWFESAEGCGSTFSFSLPG